MEMPHGVGWKKLRMLNLFKKVKKLNLLKMVNKLKIGKT